MVLQPGLSFPHILTDAQGMPCLYGNPIRILYLCRSILGKVLILSASRNKTQSAGVWPTVWQRVSPSAKHTSDSSLSLAVGWKGTSAWQPQLDFVLSLLLWWETPVFLEEVRAAAVWQHPADSQCCSPPDPGLQRNLEPLYLFSIEMWVEIIYWCGLSNKRDVRILNAAFGAARGKQWNKAAKPELKAYCLLDLGGQKVFGWGPACCFM